MADRRYSRADLEEVAEIAAQFAYGQRGPRHPPERATREALAEFDALRGEQADTADRLGLTLDEEEDRG